MAQPRRATAHIGLRIGADHVHAIDMTTAAALDLGASGDDHVSLRLGDASSVIVSLGGTLQELRSVRDAITAELERVAFERQLAAESAAGGCVPESAAG